MTTSAAERSGQGGHARDRVVLDTETAGAICDQCMDPAFYRVVVGNVALYLVCVAHVSLVLHFIEARRTGGCGADCLICAESGDDR
jgi:hypothetical protein